jgi:hypothetical protein
MLKSPAMTYGKAYSFTLHAKSRSASRFATFMPTPDSK